MSSSLKIGRLRFEHHPTGLGVDTAEPRLSWTVDPVDAASIPANWSQKSYDVEIRRSETTTVFSVAGSDTVLVPWPGKRLASQERASVRVRSHGADSVDTDWSHWSVVEASLLHSSDLTANFITLERTGVNGLRHPEENGNRPLLFRKRFEIQGHLPHRARLYITCLGVYEARINGHRVGQECLAPGWTSYQHRICFQTFDIADLVQVGENVITIEVGEGWYSGRLKWGEGEPNFYGDCNAAFAQLDSFASEGASPARLQTDDSWEATLSPIVASGIYDGETYDMRQEPDDNKWAAAKIIDRPKGTLVPSGTPPIKVTQRVKPVAINKDPDGKALIDFGQNLVGRVLIPSLSRPEGHRVVIRHAEVLEHGRLGTRPLREAKATDAIIFGPGGSSLKNWYPRFTYHGFRFIEITGWNTDDASEPLTLDSILAEVIHSDMTPTGSFSCSEPLLNQFHDNTIWSMRGNFIGIPTDCPQRDERLGWTGDIQAFCPTASFLYDCGGMLGNWMRDLIAEQREGGGIVPLVVPNAMKNGPWPAVPQAVWDDVVILLPWTLYKTFGDVGVLRDSWQGMKDYLGSVRRDDDGLWTLDLWQLGDWLDPNAPPADPGLARTDGVLVADAYLVYVTSVMSDIAKVLNLPDEASSFAAQAVKLKEAFHDKYIPKSGLVAGDSQTALALCILFDIYTSPKQLATAAARLARLVRFAKFRVSTGFAGTPVILHALEKGGYPQLAYRMMLEEECPSWLYPVRMGATTIWERWDSMLENGSINPGQMTSFNHYALGSVANWLHGTVAGISPVDPGWKTFRFRPVPGGGLGHARASFQSANGKVEAGWEFSDGNAMVADLTVPPNTSAVVEGPGIEAVRVGSGRHHFEWKVAKDQDWPPAPLLTQFQDYVE
jgi:alpha-L-rhamnosidase